MKKITFMIAGTSSGVGKTTITQGILSLFVKNGYNARSFKLGPDYIDVCSEQHFERIIETIKTKYKKRIIGYLLNSKELFINERHLGLTTVPEIKNIKEHIDNLAKTFNKTLSIDSFIILTKYFTTDTSRTVGAQIKKCCKIAVAKDKAFSFYYGYNLDYLRQLGAEIIYFSPLNDSKLPNGTNAVYFGGGFPEVYAFKLSKNKSLLTDIKEKIDNGVPLYAECGGLIYLGDTIIEFETGINSKTVGVFPFDAYVDSKLTLAYVLGKITKNCLIGKEGDSFKGHVFHQSKVKEKKPITKASYITELNTDDMIKEGYCYKNVYASYVHVHFRNCPLIAEYFVNNAIAYRRLNGAS